MPETPPKDNYYLSSPKGNSISRQVIQHAGSSHQNLTLPPNKFTKMLEQLKTWTVDMKKGNVETTKLKAITTLKFSIPFFYQKHKMSYWHNNLLAGYMHYTQVIRGKKTAIYIYISKCLCFKLQVVSVECVTRAIMERVNGLGVTWGTPEVVSIQLCWDSQLHMNHQRGIGFAQSVLQLLTKS